MNNHKKYAGIGLAQVTPENSDLVMDLATAILFEETKHIGEGDSFFGLFELDNKRDKKLSWGKLRALYPIKNGDLAHSYLKALAAFENARIFSGGFVLNKEPQFNISIWSKIRRFQKQKNVFGLPIKPVNNESDLRQNNRKNADLSEFHGDMSTVPTTSQDDGFSHMKTTPAQPFSDWNLDWKWKAEGYESFDEILNSLKTREKRQRVPINWHLITANVVYGASQRREFRLYIMPVTGSPHWEFGFKVTLTWRDSRGWHEETGGSWNGIHSACAYCQEHLAEVDYNIIRYTEADCTILVD